MIKLAATALWICLVTLGSVYASMQFATPSSEEAAAPGDFFGGLDYVRGDVVSVPVISEGAVKGYFLARLVFTAEPEMLAKLSIDPQLLIRDELYSHLVGNEAVDFTSLESFDLQGFRDGVREALNTRIGEKVFHDIIIEQIDYLSKEEIRSNLQRGGTVEAPPALVPEPAAEEAVAH